MIKIMFPIITEAKVEASSRYCSSTMDRDVLTTLLKVQLI